MVKHVNEYEKYIFFQLRIVLYANVSIDLYLCSNEAHEITCKTVVEHMDKANCLIVGKNNFNFLLDPCWMGTLFLFV